MVTKQHAFVKMLTKKIQATVLNDIWPETMFFTLIAVMLGLVVSFRTSSAYDKFSEGRKLWTSINLVSRNLAHVIWVHILNERKVKKWPNDEHAINTPADGRSALMLKTVIEKKSMINLVQAFSVAVKHALRGEAGIFYEDLYPLVCFLPKYISEPPMIDHKADVLPLWQANVLDIPVEDGGLANLGSASGQTISRTMSSPGDEKEKDIAAERVAGGDLVKELANVKHHRNRRDQEHILPVVACDRPLKPARNPPKTTLYDYIPIFLIFKPFIWLVRYLYRKIRSDKYGGLRPGHDHARDTLGRKRKAAVVESSVPLEITLFLSSYLAWLMQNDYINATFASTFSSAIISLQDAMANLDRIRGTPIPFAYQAHLRISMWLYLFFLPFEIYSSFGYLTIPATAFGSFLLLGFMEIGQEIEDPFGYDSNDLNLDEFCAVIQRELAEITAHAPPDPRSFLFESRNHPFAPADVRSAKEMIENVEHEYHGPETGLLSIRRTLLGSYRATALHRV
ncbi:hypothetical protein EW145_g3159 [Phellinidium pouzarii]|uniref:Uncharacterized protein n=1 Tax=Phellinidium pouzarii TaxID=167371 RepID=A0A4S4L820_9AGAM|nr:hypothetical protein EW145_g3159 [Phellinidium pouzarii]